MRLDPAAVIKRKQRWGDYFLLTVGSPHIAPEAAPGQFLMVKTTEGPHPLLRRPFSIHSREGGSLGIFFKVVGEGTALLAGKEPGDILNILGPLGRGFDLELGAGGGNEPQRPALAVGGGRGIAPLLFLARELRHQGRPLKILYGGRTRDDIPLQEYFRSEEFDIECSTDDGSSGFKGLVTDLLARELKSAPPTVLYACGPEPMLKAVDRMAAASGLPSQLSLEARMGCGFGACWGCVQRIRKAGGEDWVKICEEGPVFAGGEVVWPEEA